MTTLRIVPECTAPTPAQLKVQGDLHILAGAATRVSDLYAALGLSAVPTSRLTPRTSATCSRSCADLRLTS